MKPAGQIDGRKFLHPIRGRRRITRAGCAASLGGLGIGAV